MRTGRFAFLASVAFVVHGVFVVLIVPSSLLLLLGHYHARPLLGYLHWTAVVVMVAGAAYYGRCLLVELEERLRVAAGKALPYEGSFTVYFLRKLTGREIPKTLVTMGSRLVVLLTLGSLIVPFPQ